MKRACIKLNTNTDEQNTSSIRPIKINFVRMKRNQLTLILLIIVQLNISAQNKLNETLFNYDWKFCLGNIEGGEKPELNDNTWRHIDLPHDWSIEDLNIPDTTNGRMISGPFDSNAESGKHSGFTVGGTGWYRKHFKLSSLDTGKIVYINFDGIYMNYDVWINGHHIGNQPYGYTANWYNLTPYIHYGEKGNIIAVRVKNEGVNSRWYSGSGIYRNVTLSIVDKIHVSPWGLFVQTPKVDSSQAEILVEANILNRTDINKDVDILFEIYHSKSEIVASKKISTQIHHQVPSNTKARLTIDKPELWSPDSPELYRIVCIIKLGNTVLDEHETTFGIRTIEFDPENGMFLNGKNIKLKGGALHANNGPLGACAYYRAEERRVELMKNLGFNAIRCAHNPPSKVFLDACDRLGMLVIDETFDVWQNGWLPDDYHKYFNEWWKHDVRNMILRDRNHPSVFTWSMRNQVREAKDSNAIVTGKEIAGFIRLLDPSRPVMANVSMMEDHFDGNPELWKLRDPFFEILDICGYSYQSAQFTGVHKRLPDRIQFSSEIDPLNCFKNWMRVLDNDFVIGNFTWTAMDFMGEVALGWRRPFRMSSSELFPWTNSFSGDIDICAFRKPRSYYRDILFERGSKLSLFVKPPVPSFENNQHSRWGWEDVKSSWTWPGHEGDSLQVVAYSACDSISLFLNGKMLGTKATSRSTEFKAYWNVPCEEGELQAIGYVNGKEDTSTKLQTTSKPYSIRLTADRDKIKADKQDLSFITVEITDKNNHVIPYADNMVYFDIKGEGTLAGVGNGNPVSLESFQQPYRKAYEGKCLLIVKSTGKTGEISVLARSKGLKSGKMFLSSNKKADNSP